MAKAAARVGSIGPGSASEWLKTNAVQACILTHELPSLAARGFRRCLGWCWRGIGGVGELEVDRAGAFLDLRRQGRGARIAVAGGDKAFGFCFRLVEELLRDKAGILPSRLFLKDCLGFGVEVAL